MLPVDEKAFGRWENERERPRKGGEKRISIAAGISVSLICPLILRVIGIDMNRATCDGSTHFGIYNFLFNMKYIIT